MPKRKNNNKNKSKKNNKNNKNKSKKTIKINPKKNNKNKCNKKYNISKNKNNPSVSTLSRLDKLNNNNKLNKFDEICNGDGSCLTQTDEENGYEKRDDILCDNNCKPIKCPNFIICNVLLPKWVSYCHNNLCTNCDILFGLLKITDNIKCPICLENTKGVKLLKCNHHLCIKCFKRCYYGDDDLDNEPIFPYSADIEDKYFDLWAPTEKERIKQKNEFYQKYPLIQKYNLEYNLWDDNKQLKYESEKSLRKCPICCK